eukprot:COSAG03_NODE_2802_length_2443_cov_130.674061_1_plen_26_part_10
MPDRTVCTRRYGRSRSRSRNQNPRHW